MRGARTRNKADVQKRGQASSDDGNGLALTFTQPVEPRKSKNRTKRKNSAGIAAAATPAGICTPRGGLLFDRRQAPLTLRHVVYYCSAVYMGNHRRAACLDKDPALSSNFALMRSLTTSMT